MNMQHSILKDDRDLEWVEAIDQLQEGYAPHVVGSDGVTRIAVVAETGEMAYVPTVCVWKGETLWRRIAWHGVHSVGYPCIEGVNESVGG